MILGYNAFNPVTNPVHNNITNIQNIEKLVWQNVIIDDIFGDTDITIPIECNDKMDWAITTIIYAQLNTNLEGGSLQLQEDNIDKLLFQRRKIGDNVWEDIGSVYFDAELSDNYMIEDKNIQNDYEYEYSVLPVSHNNIGNRITSSKVRAQFEGCFLSDIDNNYMFIYDEEWADIEHNTNSAIMQPLSSRYPYFIQDNMQYRSGSVSAVFISEDMADGVATIQKEHLSREKLISFMLNGKPKTLRFANGNTMVVHIVDNPTESSIAGTYQYMGINFNYIEIDALDEDGLKSANLIPYVGGGINE